MIARTTNATLQERLERLQEMRTQGVRKVSIDGEEVEYRSDAELAAAIADLRRQIGSSSGASRSIIYPKVSKGY